MGLSPGTQGRGETVTLTFGRPIVSIRDVQKESGGLEVSKGVTLGIMRSEVISIVNRSGSGTSKQIRVTRAPSSVFTGVRVCLQHNVHASELRQCRVVQNAVPTSVMPVSFGIGAFSSGDR